MGVLCTVYSLCVCIGFVANVSTFSLVSGKNANYRSSYNSFENWERTHGYGIVGESSSEGDDDSDPRKFAENGYDPSCEFPHCFIIQLWELGR